MTLLFQETMRLYPAGGVATFRRSKTGKDVVLGGGKLVVPAGVGLHMPITAVHHTEGIWENPMAFTPERFLEVCHSACSRCQHTTVLQDARKKSGHHSNTVLCSAHSADASGPDLRPTSCCTLVGLKIALRYHRIWVKGKPSHLPSSSSGMCWEHGDEVVQLLGSPLPLGALASTGCAMQCIMLDVLSHSCWEQGTACRRPLRD